MKWREYIIGGIFGALLGFLVTEGFELAIERRVAQKFDDTYKLVLDAKIKAEKKEQAIAAELVRSVADAKKLEQLLVDANVKSGFLSPEAVVPRLQKALSESREFKAALLNELASGYVKANTYYYVRWNANSNRYLDVNGGRQDNGTMVDIAAGSHPVQRWKLTVGPDQPD